MKTIGLAFGALVLAACGGSDPLSNEADNLNAPTDIDVLPPDETAATPADELANGDQSNSSAEAGNRTATDTP